MTSKSNADEAFLEKACSDLQAFVESKTGILMSRSETMAELRRILKEGSPEAEGASSAFSVAYCSDDPRDVEIYKQVVRAESKDDALKQFVAIKLSEGDFSDYQIFFVQNETTHDLFMFSGQDGEKDILIREGMVAMIHEYFPLPEHLMRAAGALSQKPDDHGAYHEFMQSLRIRQVHRARTFLGLDPLSDEQAVALDRNNDNPVDPSDVAEILGLVSDFLSSGVDLPNGRGVVVLRRAGSDLDEDPSVDQVNPATHKTLH